MTPTGGFQWVFGVSIVPNPTIVYLISLNPSILIVQVSLSFLILPNIVPTSPQTFLKQRLNPHPLRIVESSRVMGKVKQTIVKHIMVNMRNLIEEDKVITGIHDIYEKMDFQKIGSLTNHKLY